MRFSANAGFVATPHRCYASYSLHDIAPSVAWRLALLLLPQLAGTLVLSEHSTALAV
jgi:hypothetical protein